MKKLIAALLTALLLMVALPVLASSTFKTLPGQTCWGSGHTVHIHVKNTGNLKIDQVEYILGAAGTPVAPAPGFNVWVRDDLGINPGQTRVGDLSAPKVFSYQQGSGDRSFIRVTDFNGPSPTIQVWYSCS